MAGTAPTATASLNKSAYSPGETMVLTVDHTDVDRSVLTVTVTVNDSQGNSSAPASATAVVDDGTVTFTETGGKTWALQSATLNRSVFTATA